MFAGLPVKKNLDVLYKTNFKKNFEFVQNTFKNYFENTFTKYFWKVDYFENRK